MGKLMIYGATGYTGRIACQHAKSLDLQFVLGGRSQGKLAELAAQLTAPYMVFSVDNPDDIALALKDIKVLLNCAGPFGETAGPLMATCIEKGVHYLDFSAELYSYQLAGKLDEKARRSGVMLLPGCGGSVSMLGCLVLHALRSEEQAVSIDVALYVTGPMSRGSAISAAASLSPDCLQRRDGTLVQQDVNSTKQFDFDDGHGPVACFPVTLPDLITIWKSTGVSNIRTFVRTSAGSFPTTDLAALPDGPTAEQRKANPYHASVIITKQDNDTRRAVLHTVNGYTFTGIASVEAAKRVFAGEVKGGFQTPAEVFGKGFVESVTGSRIVDI
ncbi:Saccharopine dehydrogenase-domain-containing protein [Xylaria longipes]|nr:Saccharopine dehydrogenase-domain-containing protein [Xylaria longipes]